MYYLVQKKKNMSMPDAHYSFKSFKELYDLAGLLTVPIFGRYTFVITSEKMTEITEFINREKEFSEFIVYIVTPKNVIDTVSLRIPEVNVKDSSSDYDSFIKLVEKHSILFKKGVLDLLYRSIEHDYSTMDTVLFQLKDKYGTNEVSEKDISTLVVLNKTVYPREVVMSFLRQERWRYQKLRKCLEQMSNDVIYFSMLKIIKSLVDDKAAYLRTGVGKGNIKWVSTNNLLLMYRTVVLNRSELHDVELLMRLYEKGVNVNDIVQGETV